MSDKKNEKSSHSRSVSRALYFGRRFVERVEIWFEAL